jgi:hypothetical protein
MVIDSLANYYKRKAEESSVSKFIQTNVPSETGDVITKDIEGLPNQVIAVPQITDVTQIKVEIPSLSLPKLPSLPTIPTVDSLIAMGTNSLNSMLSSGIGSLMGMATNFLSGFGLPSLVKKFVPIKLKESPPDYSKSEYGSLQVKEMKGGFVEIFDQTKGNETTLRFHPSGTYNQVQADGTNQDKVVGKKKDFYDQNWEITIGKDFIEVISGEATVQIKKDSFMTINGNSNTTINQDCNTIIDQHQFTDVKGMIIEKSGMGKNVDITGTSTENITKDYGQTVGGSSTTTITGYKTEIVKKGLDIMVTGNVTIYGDEIKIVGKKKISLVAPKISINGS